MERKELTYGDKVNLILFVARAFTFCFLPLLRYRLGKEALGITAVVAFAIQLIYIEVTQDLYMVRYLGAWCIALLFQRINADKTAHSLFEGYLFIETLLRRAFGFIPNDWFARLVEGLFVVAFGVLCLPVSEAMGKFIICGGVTILTIHQLDVFAVSIRLQRIRDQEMEMRMLHEQYEAMKRRRN